MKNIYLCGFMGCGKSTVGKLAAKLMSMKFVDMDSYIEQACGMRISSIFEQRGEQAFRSLETDALRSLAQIPGVVIATGGGALVNPLNARIAAENGRIVYLDLPFEACFARIAQDENRPIVQANTEQGLREIYASRVPLYRAHATDVVDASASPQLIAKQIKQLMR